MHIPPGSGKASAVLKLQYLATGMKSKTESEGVGMGEERAGKGTQGRQSSTHLCDLLLFLLDFFSPPQFLLQADASACLKTK